MLSSRSVVATLSLLAITTACDRDPPTATTKDDVGRVAQDVAQAFAIGMLDATVRIEVRDALRASPFVDHKLGLLEFLATPAGRDLVDVVARKNGTPPETILALARKLPPMDFYVPFADDRREWSGAANLVVAATLRNETMPDVFFVPGGRETTYRRHSGYVLFLLEPAEPKDLRIDAQPAVPGTVIQDRDDGEVGGAIMQYDRDGRLVSEVQLARIFSRRAKAVAHMVAEAEGCDPMTAFVPCDGGSGTSGGNSGPPPAADTTLLTGFFTNANDGGWTLEFEWTSTYFDANGAAAGTQKLRKTGVHSYSWYMDWRDILIFRRIRKQSNERIDIHLVETDVWSDDNCGWETIHWNGANQWWDHSTGGSQYWIVVNWTEKP